MNVKSSLKVFVIQINEKEKPYAIIAEIIQQLESYRAKQLVESSKADYSTILAVVRSTNEELGLRLPGETVSIFGTMFTFSIFIH